MSANSRVVRSLALDELMVTFRPHRGQSKKTKLQNSPAAVDALPAKGCVCMWVGPWKEESIVYIT